MSDSIEDLVRRYEENVFKEEHPRSIGLFTIPEYPEFEANRGMWSVALDAILTTLRYLAPATLLTLFWGQQSFLFKLLKHIDSAFRAIVFSSEEQKQSVLLWLAEAGPVRVEHLDTVWRHGWVLCGVLDAALPGACAGHPPTRLSLKHAQAIADHYLGVEPVFSRQELESNDSLSRHQEWKLATYLDRIRQALSKLTPPVSKPVSQRTSPETTQFTLDYVAKGSGLSAAQVNHKAHFKIYPTAQQALDPGEITILIRGPRDTYGMTVLPPILGKAQMIRQKLLGLQSKQTFTENALPITQGATYLRSYGKTDMNKTYYIPKTKYDIEIEAEARTDHAKIGYVLNIEGKYLISITSRGQSIVGSPFTITVADNIISILENDSFCLEDGEEIDIVDVKTDRKVVLRIVDFVTEKMLLKENGTLEKISDDEAKILMTTDTENDIRKFDSETYCNVENREEATAAKNKRFNNVAYKILALNRVCKIFNDVIAEKPPHFAKKENYIRSRSQQDIPDIVNSTLSETNLKPYIISELREKFIVPENISVSLRAEKSTTYYESEPNSSTSEIENVTINIPLMESTRNDTPDSMDGFNVSYEDQEDNVSVDRLTPSSTYNPFLNEMFEENYVASKNLGPFVASEYETNNSQNEETRDSSITIVIDSNLTSSPVNRNPFMETDNTGLVKPDPAALERPKTPVFKIISGEKVNRDESVFLDPKSQQINDEALGNEFVNPFFMHHHQSGNFEQSQPMTDFIIGAPVSLPPILRARSPEPEIKALVLPGKEKCKKRIQTNKKQAEKAEQIPKPELFTPLQNTLTLPKDSKKENISAVSSTFHSLESNLTETTIDTSNASTTSDNNFEPYQIDSDRNLTPRKDIWDSAYVSIDDSNSSPDSNNNESTALSETLSKQKFSPSDDNFGLKQEEITNMGPAEREIWQTCNELKIEPTKSQEEPKPYKWEFKRPMFTPIIEESDRSISSGTKDLSRPEICTKQTDTDSVSVAFAELNDMYKEYFPNSETRNSITIADELCRLHSTEEEYVKQIKDDSVDSASELTDVKRHVEELEGTISEVQANVTESVSVSQPLRIETEQHFAYGKENKDETQFGETNRSNIVLEKKKYWDERIRQIEAKSAETSTLPKKKRISAKQLKHDSLTKRKGKQIVKNFLNAGDYSQVKPINQAEDKEVEIKVHEPLHSTDDQIKDISPDVNSDEKLVGRWKKYWDDKLETDQEEAEAVALRMKSPKIKVSTLSPSSNQKSSTKVESPVEIKIETHYTKVTSPSNEQPPVKHELPEEVFKAFETSPKRFFGTSRQQILNKIDTFLGKPATVDIPTADITGECHESGLVSSRISLFHNMSNTEELPWARRKSQSLQNVSQKRESDKNIVSLEEPTNKEVVQDNEILNSRINETTNVNITDAVNLKTKRARMVTTRNSTNNKTFDETVYVKPVEEQIITPKPKEHVRMAVKDLNKELQPNVHKVEILRKKSFSKSEMDIFNKIPNDTVDDGLDKYKSCDELPKINVKSFISLYESVTKTAAAPKPAKRVFRTSSGDSQKMSQSYSTTSDAAQRRGAEQESVSNCESIRTTPGVTPTNLWISKDSETVSNLSIDTRTSGSFDIEIIPHDNKETTYHSLSDIELEIIECSPDKSSESSPDREIEPAHIEYKNRFKLAKEFFQSIEELREVKKPRKLNECEQLLQKQSTESLEIEERPQKRVKKNIKSHSLPSSEISKIWNQLQESQGSDSTTKLVKISEKFNVDDLFTDVTEGKLSRQGSLRGIPHKKAVLEAFRSMENIAPTNINSYEFAETQLTDFAKEHTVKNAQTYLSEYPYLPTTDPSKYHSRLDIKASGLISLKELKERKPRRNSVPDLRLNPKFTEDL